MKLCYICEEQEVDGNEICMRCDKLVLDAEIESREMDWQGENDG